MILNRQNSLGRGSGKGLTQILNLVSGLISLLTDPLLMMPIILCFLNLTFGYYISPKFNSSMSLTSFFQQRNQKEKSALASLFSQEPTQPLKQTKKKEEESERQPNETNQQST